MIKSHTYASLAIKLKVGPKGKEIKGIIDKEIAKP